MIHFLADRRPELDDRTRRILQAVADCPHRGTELPPDDQPSNLYGCQCPNLYVCHLSRGSRPEGASFEDCVTCRVEVTDLGVPG